VPDRVRSRRGPGRRAAEPVETDTAFAHARVEPDPAWPGGRVLLLDGHEASHVDLDDPRHLAWSYVRRIGDVIDAFRPPGTAIDAVHLGGGACTLARYVLATRPRSTNEVHEIDPGVLDLARTHLGLRTSPRLRVRIGAAQDLLARRDDRSADLVIGDAFEGQDVPAAFGTPAFAATLERVLRPAGVHVLNVVDHRGAPLARDHAATLQTAFAHVALVAPRAVLRNRAGGNVIVVASNAPLPRRELAARAAGSVDREEVVPLEPNLRTAR
jgi:hypothetical protein